MKGRRGRVEGANRQRATDGAGGGSQAAALPSCRDSLDSTSVSQFPLSRRAHATRAARPSFWPPSQSEMTFRALRRHAPRERRIATATMTMSVTAGDHRGAPRWRRRDGRAMRWKEIGGSSLPSCAMAYSESSDGSVAGLWNSADRS